MLKCENTLCIYQKEGSCALNSVALDEGGRCTACILTDFPKEILEEAKRDTFMKINL